MIQDQRDLILEFHELIKDKYNLTEKQTLEIIRGPWKYFKESMKGPTFPKIRVKYLGYFLIKPYMAVWNLKKLKELPEHTEHQAQLIPYLENYTKNNPVIQRKKYQNQSNENHTEEH